YLHKEVGYNYRMSNIQAAIGVGMLPHLEELVLDRRRIFEQYKSGLEQLIDFQPEATGAISNRWLTAGLCANEDLRDKLIQQLEEHGIEARPVWRPMHVQPLCKDVKFFGSGVAEDLWKRGICLPSGYGLDPSPIIKIVKEILG
ncbi:DegT/DnrJ/EryC1/StrS family aminotransferase, partial [Flavobacteriaceae bacterium]|nr:DegT/DnrJ/EryC1/StrS family aminotransferase [Flavobacteriaceae bacterium]